MFDWDKDHESLVSTAAKPQVSSGQSRPDRSGSGGKLVVCLLVLTIAMGFAYEKNLLSHVRGASIVGFTSFDAPSFSKSESIAVPDGLVAYDEARALRYMQGLRRADAATLHGYAAHLASDLEQTSPALRPFLRDAQTLLRGELARRAASAS